MSTEEEFEDAEETPALPAGVFLVEGERFKLAPLPTTVSHRLYKHLGTVVKPSLVVVLAGGTFNMALFQEALNQSLEALDEKTLEPIKEAFKDSCRWFNRADKKWHQLAPFFEKVFQRKHRRFLLWVGACIEQEYGDFLEGIGQSLPRLMKELFPSTSPSGATGPSGDPSSSTDKSTPTSETAGG